ncbi:hypothetical protein ACFWIQ_19630 [Kitasatospora sp. NPDC127059]|uniref:AMP-binding enzyme n=1 Tax=unclassified Kitasatospora TaxID=2633591 RepID=UPI00365DE455
MTIVEGHNVFPQEVEESLRTHPDVREAVMFATTDPDRLERVHAVVAVRPHAPAPPEQLRRWAREHADARCAPDTVLVLSSIPPNGLGKPDPSALRALVEERTGRTVTAARGRARECDTPPRCFERPRRPPVAPQSAGRTERGHSTVRAELPIHPGGAPSHRPQEALP